jgi:branched-chain amino acid transport system ATP-binding protein
MLALSGVHAHYGHIEALRGVDLEVARGEIVALIGANGAGKSTLLMTICGHPVPTAGRILLDGADIAGLPTFEIVRRGIAQVPEGRRIFSRMTVLENLQMGAVAAGEVDFTVELERAFALFPVLAERRAQRGGTLSGGEQQMLAIARALMARPRLLLLDEPSLGLAPLIVKQIFRVIGEINRDRGTTVLLVEQNAYHALRLAHRGYVMAQGRILMQGSGAALLADPEIRAAYLEGGAKPAAV